MKNKFLQYFTVFTLCLYAPMAHGVVLSKDAVINWADDFGSTLIESSGLGTDTLDSGTYQIQLGSFDPNFTPDDLNLVDWAANWKVFDQAEFNDTFGYFTGGEATNSVISGGTGYSLSNFATANYNFSNQDAYIWIFNQQAVDEDLEWFLGRVSNWVFPDAVNFEECCGNDHDQQWSLSTDDDPLLGGTVEVLFGGYKDKTFEGAGTYTDAEVSYLVQTYTIIPEFSTLVQTLAILGTAFLFTGFRRKT
jgi:hypothetical protein